MTDASRAELAAWLGEDRRNRGAFAQAQALLHMTEEAVRRGPPLISGNEDTYPAARRFVHGPGRIAIAACLAVLVASGMFALAIRQPQGSGVQVMKLADGSVATLADGARIEVDMSGGARRVTLVSGGASFKVFHDQAHPFIVRSGEVFAQATGTEYSVSRVGEAGGTVGVSEGSVLVWASDERDQAVLLRAGGSMTLDPGVPADPRPQPPELAQISLDGETIASAAARFNRINRTRIVVEGAAIGQARLVGQFRADNPEQFARAAAAVADARVVHRDGAIVITRGRE